MTPRAPMNEPLRYGFVNEFASEGVARVLPHGRNSDGFGARA